MYTFGRIILKLYLLNFETYYERHEVVPGGGGVLNEAGSPQEQP